MKITIENFKSIAKVNFEAGKINVLIGANGSGKSAVLEALGVLSAAIEDRVDDSIIRQKGVRLGTPALYKSSFISQERNPLIIKLGAKWDSKGDNWDYSVNLNNPLDKPKPAWEYHSEKLNKNGRKVIGRSRATYYQLENFPHIKIDAYRGLLSFLQGVESDIQRLDEPYNFFSGYGIYTPNTSTLRGIQPDPYQRPSVGLLGGRLEDAVSDLLNVEKDLFGTLELDELLELIDWVGDFEIGKPSRQMLSSNVPTPAKTILFRDRFMKEGRNVLTPYDASEGALYVLFVLSLAMHSKSPRMFAIDNFDQALNPRLARKLTKVFCEQVINNDRVAFLTTHNPLVLDGLNLLDDRIRLFAIDRNSDGHTEVNRINISEELLAKGKEGYSLSRLWITGRLGGVPNL